MVELLGKWTGVCYYESIRPFITDNTMKLEIIMKGEDGSLRGKVTEICEMGGARKSVVQENLFHLTGKFDEKAKTLRFTGEGERKERAMSQCSLELRIKGEDKLVGEFRDPSRAQDVQKVELYKGEVRRDLEELQERGRAMIRKWEKMEENGEF